MEQEPQSEARYSPENPISWGCPVCEGTQSLTDSNTLVTYFTEAPEYSYITVTCDNGCDGRPYFVDEETIDWLVYITNVDITKQPESFVVEGYKELYGHEPEKWACNVIAIDPVELFSRWLREYDPQPFEFSTRHGYKDATGEL